MTTAEIIFPIIAAIFGSTGLFTFIQYLITRKDNNNQKLDDLQESVDSIQNSISNIHQELDNIRKMSKENFDLVNDNIDRSHAVQARIRILRANDEMRQHVQHSYEYFRQLHQDITEYEKYCTSHPEFKNNEAVNSIEYINRVYLELLENNAFLT